MRLSLKNSLQWEAAKIVSIYILFGFAWIYFSDTVLGWFVHDEKLVTTISIIKGLLFIVFTSCLLFFLITRLNNKIQQATVELQESEERFRFLVKNSSDNLVILNADGSQRYVSPAAERTTGFPVSELEGRKLDTIIHPDDMANVLNAWEEAIQHPEKTVTVQYRHIHKTKGWFYSEAIVQSFLKETAINGIIASIRDITKHKQSEEAIKNARRILQTVIDTVPSRIFYKDLELRYLGCNKAFARDAGVENPQDLIGKDDYQLAWMQQSELYRSDDRLVIDSGSPKLSFEEPQTTPEGNEKWLRTSKVPLRNESNEIIGVVGVYEDITEQKISTDMLRLRESYLSAIIENQPGLMWLKDTDGKFLAVNTKFAKSCGVNDPEILIGKTDLDIWPKELAEKYIADDIEVIRSKKPVTKEETIFDEGQIRWFETFKTPIADDEGIVIGSTGYAHDITERRQDEEALRESEIELQNLLQTIQAGVIVHDVKNNKIKKYNQTALKILGLKKEQFLGKSTSEPGWGLIGEDGAPLTKDNYPVNIVKKTRKPLVDYIIGITNASEQEPTWVIIKANPQFDQSGELTEIIISSMDITELRNTRDLLRKKDQQLLQAQKMEAIGTLAGGIAHDFNNILGAILGYAEMVQEDCPIGSSMRSDIDQVVEASLRAKELIKQILSFSRQHETDERILQPALLIKDAIKMLRASLPTTIEIQQNIDPETGLILADPIQIHQIVTNLCTNAFHAMEESGGTLNITIKNKELTMANLAGETHVKPGLFVEISVGDTGPGVAPEIMDKIFNPFFTTKEVGKGTGMGLAIIHGIVKKSGGFVTCKSSVGQGTTFFVYLPVHVDTISPEAETKPLELIQPGIERILFIDDEEMLAGMGKTMLERLGYRVTAVTNSIEALKLIQNQPDRFDLVITDQTMPGMTGSDLARRILQIRPELPIILCTGFSNQISEEKAKIYGIKGFAMKPLAKKDLAVLVRKVLDGEK